jgi:DegV family protein with EDD domain
MFQQGARLEPVLSFLEDLQSRIQIVAMLDTLEYVRRSGRVSWARARLGNMLHIKPFIGLKNGVVSSLGECRTRTKGLQRLMSFLLSAGRLERLAILHTNAESEARKFLNELPVKLENDPLIVNVTTVIGVHVGPNGLGFAAVAC